MHKLITEAANAATWALIAIPLIAVASAAHAQALSAPQAAYAKATPAAYTSSVVAPR